MINISKIRVIAGTITLSSIAYAGAVYSADEVATAPKVKGAAATLMEEVVTSARKKSSGEEVQEVPIAMTASTWCSCIFLQP